MNWITTLKHMQLTMGTAVALGFFDGVHIGHRAVLREAVRTRTQGLQPVAFSFSTATSRPPGKAGMHIYSDKQRAGLLYGCGMEQVLLPPFGEFSHWDAQMFCAFLCGPLHARMVFCGDDYRFARGASADVSDLEKLCGAFGTRVCIASPLEACGGRVSSTRIRSLLEVGAMTEAGKLLGVPYFLETPVEHGKRLGRQMGFPTVNQPFQRDVLPPRRGVYAAWCYVGAKRYEAVTNIGVNPTVERGIALRAETHLLDFTGDLYGNRVRTEPIRFLRDERRFPNMEALAAQIAADCAAARDVLKQREMF